ncbi:TPM domain-containing protein [Nocardia jinanensis]|uniref:Membrane protein n=1 Tax=Nocardia jinanensis TaxID=382504 RepID=A0A917VVF3_9NOCA|nr:TPM domain-containing protein [Nocardia jinanensis]GGL23508.1 membrane protein [Nocardia jinanensis]
MPTSNNPLRRVAWFVLGLALAAAVAAPGATAEQPTRMDTYVTDSAGALDRAGAERVRAAVDTLYAAHKVRLWVAYVGDFAGDSPQDWAAQTARQSGFGDRDLLLAVATRDRAYAFDGELPSGVSESEVDRILTDRVEPALRDDRWADAGVAAAEGIDSAMSGGGVSTGPVLLIGALIVLVSAGLLLYQRYRRRARDRAELAQARETDPTDPAALAALPLEALHTRSREVLVELDNAVRTSAEELELAAGEFGGTAVLPFRAALENARAATAKAFAIRQQLDDAVPETPDEQRTLLIDLITTAGHADRELDARVAEFDAMRDLLIDAGPRLDALTRDIVDLTGRIPASEAELTRLAGAHPASVLAPISDNVTMAGERIAFADGCVGDGRREIARPVGEQGGAVADIRAAEGAIGQARTLLDAVDGAAAHIQQARDGLPAVLDELRGDLGAAGELTEHGGPELETAVAAARTALESAGTTSEADPLGVYHDAVAADGALDRALAAAGDRKVAAEDLTRRLDRVFADAATRVRMAGDFIATRRGAVDATPRTRLSEAQRHLDEAQRLRTEDPAAALDHARTAADLGGRALQEAQAGVQTWEVRRPPPGTAQTGAILGGILIDSMLRGGTGGGFGGGRGRRGGYRAASFGGSGGSRRVSRGGRF